MAIKNKWDPKDPADIDDFWYNWAPRLPTGVTIVSELVTGPDEIDVVATDFLGPVVRVRLGGGVAASSYPIDCTVTLSNGTVLQETSVLQVKERIIK